MYELLCLLEFTGGSTVKPGEISLAHNGILFLDELPEFKRDVLEVLRQPLEEREITISRALRTVTFPAGFMIVAAMNPCPCGNFGSNNLCRCNNNQIKRYLNKVSGPLLDRIDIHIEVPAVKYEDLRSKDQSESSKTIQSRVVTARSIQLNRFAKETVYTNAQMPTNLVKTHCRLTKEGESLLKQAITSLGISARAYDKLLKISRTIADMEQSKHIQSHHLAEAISHRSLDRNYWN